MSVTALSGDTVAGVSPPGAPAPKHSLFRSNVAYLDEELRRLRRRLETWVSATDRRDVSSLRQVARLERRERQQLAALRTMSAANGTDIPFEGLVRRTGLSLQDEALVMAAAAPHFSASVGQFMLQAEGANKRGWTSVGFLADLLRVPTSNLSDHDWAQPESPLLQRGLLEVSDVSGRGDAILSQRILCPHFVAAAIEGRAVVDPRIAGVASLRVPQRRLYEVVLSASSQRQVSAFMEVFRARRQASRDALAGRGEVWRVQVAGPRGSGKTSLVEALAMAQDGPLFTVRCAELKLLKRPGDALRLASRNAALFGATLHLEAPEVLAKDPSLGAVLFRVAQRYAGLVALEPRGDSGGLLDGVADTTIRLSAADQACRMQLWEAALPPELPLEEAPKLGSLARQYELSGGQIDGAVRWGAQRARCQGRGLRHEDLEEGARAQLSSRLDKFTHTPQAQVTMADLVLEPECKTQVEDLLGAARHRQQLLDEWGFGARLPTGRGLVALLSGSPGTGKTLCAEILGAELGLELHMVSVPNIVSKWVGETSKNMRDVFAEARSKNALLVFDEADALFGKRVTVERGQDQMQNMDINTLLQELERYDGVVLMTTNLASNMDDAFSRRILFKIEFDEPKPEQRELIWRRLIPADMPLCAQDPVDFEALAHDFDLTGGRIKNAVMRAAYRCISTGSAVTQAALQEAARQESAAAGKLVRIARD